MRALLVACALLAAPAQAQDAYPSRPLRFILPFPPGGGTDILGRLLAERLSANLGQPVVTENRGGAGGNVGAEAAARAAPDGYTIVLVAPSLAISPTLYAKLNYDPVKDFAPIALVASFPNVMVTHPSVPAQNLREFIALAKSQLTMEMLKARAGFDMVHVPYRGGAPATTATVAGEVAAMFAGTSTAPQIKAGRLRALAVLARERSPLLPEVPTADEAGLPNFDVTTWYGIMAPAGTPQPVIARLNAEFVKIMHSPDLKERLAGMGTDVMTSTPEEFAAYLKREIAKWGEVIRKANLRAD